MSFTWATVTATSPLRVKLDGDSAALLITPDSIAGQLAIGDRVRCELHDGRIVVFGASTTQAGQTFFGVIDPSWAGGGSTMPVVIASLSRTVSALASTSIPALTPGATVMVERFPGDIFVTVDTYADPYATPQYSGPLTLLPSGLLNYYRVTQVSIAYSPLVAYRTKHGWNMVQGLLVANVALTTGTVLANLPPIFRPIQEKRFFASNAGTGGYGIVVRPNGDMIIEGAPGAGTLISLAFGYNNDSTLARTAMPLAPSGPAWTAFGASPYGGSAGTPQYAVDASSRIIYEGLVKGGTASTNTYITTALPTGKYNSVSGSLHKSYELSAAGRFARVDATGSPVATSAGRISALGVYTGLSLEMSELVDTVTFPGAISLTAAAGTNYGSGWTTGQIVPMPDGSVQLRGLMSGALSVQLPIGLAPKHTIIFPTDTTDAPGRVDVSPNGTLALVSGTNTFISLEDIQWMPAEAMEAFR